MTEQWDWLLTTCRKIAKHFDARPEEVDELVSEVYMKLVSDTALAERLFNEKNVAYLFTMIKHEKYKAYSKTFFDNANDYSRYRRIINICKEYNIAAIPENAYKISALIGEREFSIHKILSLFESKKPTLVSIEEINNI